MKENVDVRLICDRCLDLTSKEELFTIAINDTKGNTKSFFGHKDCLERTMNELADKYEPKVEGDEE